MLEYVKAHWRGDLSLGRSYWVNGILLTFLFGVGHIILDQSIANGKFENILIISLAFMIFAAVITVWQFVGIWRSATKSAIWTGRRIWPGIAKSAVVVASLGGTVSFVTASADLIRVYVALKDPMLQKYSIERVGDTDIVFTGAINEKSVDDILSALEDPSVTLLRVRSHGGLIPPAMRLARHIKEREIMVMAEEQCVSACVMLLAASPYAAIAPGTIVTFHRFGPVADLTNPDLRTESEAYIREAEKFFAELGIADWAMETAGRQEFWTPTVEQQIRMGLIGYIYDPDLEKFVDADGYCAQHPEQCSGPSAAVWQAPLPPEPSAGVWEASVAPEPSAEVSEAPVPPEPSGGVSEAPVPVEPPEDVSAALVPPEPSTGSSREPVQAEPEEHYWVTAGSLNRRTCPSTACGVIGRLLFREETTVYEQRGEWARISNYYPAACVNGRSEYVATGSDRCAPENGIVDGEVAEWVSARFLAQDRPEAPAGAATGIEDLIAKSDDYQKYRVHFAKATRSMISSGQCSESDFKKVGRWLKSYDHPDTPIYFTYCGDLTLANRLFLNADTGEIFR